MRGLAQLRPAGCVAAPQPRGGSFGFGRGGAFAGGEAMVVTAGGGVAAGPAAP